MKLYPIRQLITFLCTAGMITSANQAMASGFQLWEQSAGSVGNYHAGYAASAEDASTAFFNPAGITRFKNQQVVLGLVAIPTSFKFKGILNVNTIEGGEPHTVTAQGGTFSLVPNLHYVAPINEWLGFGFSIAAPFGLKTDYGRDSDLRYNATLTSVAVVDISPSLGVKANDQISFGAGFDVQLMRGEFDLVGAMGPSLDTGSTNKANDTGYGYHLGALYEFNPAARVGLSYHSQVVHHLTGTSKFVGPLALAVNTSSPITNHITSENAKVNVKLPPYTALSGYYHFLPEIALMGSVIYTQWSTFKTLSLQNLAGIDFVATPFGMSLGPSKNILVNLPENYKNSWNVSIGSDYFVTDRLTLRGGLGFDQTPVRNAYRNVQLPDNNRYVIALGGHYKLSNCIALDLGWTHLFIHQASVNPPKLKVGMQEVDTHGKVTGGADVYGAQVTWTL